MAAAKERYLVAWFYFSLNGGIGRFIRLAEAFEKMGITLEFASLLSCADTPWPGLKGKVLTWPEAEARVYDGVMIPGAGAPIKLLDRLEALRHPRFGLRIQHVLCDPYRGERFLAVNRAAAPHRVLFNNRHWTPEDRARLKSGTFHVIAGAVDGTRFHPAQKTTPLDPPYWRVGGLASKIPLSLVEAMEYLPANYLLHLYGPPRPDLEERLEKLQRTGRCFLHGPLFGRELACFYRAMDLVVALEDHAGWCNTAAEAFASGVPCAVTRAGTLEFARHEENCLLLEKATPGAIAAAILRLSHDADLRARFAAAAPEAMRPFSWEKYAEALHGLLRRAKAEAGVS